VHHRQSKISQFSRPACHRRANRYQVANPAWAQLLADDLSLVGCGDVDTAKILTSAQVTDTYLLALAKAHGGQLASFDRKLLAAAVKGGKYALHLIPTK
jgi:predicted nucleic acid-binding protein